MATVTGNAGKNIIHRAGDGHTPPMGYSDIIGVTTGNDVVYGLQGDDMLFGDAGNDYLFGGAGADALVGGDGIDRAQYDDAPTAVVADLESPANNTGIAAGDTYSSIEYLSGSSFGDSLRGDENANSIWGNGGGDALYGRGGADVLYGGDGDDTLVGGAGADSLVGGAGYNYASYAGATAGVVANWADPSQNTGDAAGDTYAGNEILGLIGSGFNDVLGGSFRGPHDILSMGFTLDGGAGNDVLNDNAITSHMIGGVGDDTYVVDNLGVRFGGPHHFFYVGTDTIVENVGEGFDHVMASVDVDLRSIANGQEIEMLETDDINGTSSLSLVGNNFTHTIIGNAGDNSIQGSLTGNNALYGGVGNDVYYVDNAGDAVVEGSGAGTDLVYSSVNYTLGSNVEKLILNGSGNLNGWGNSLANTLTGNSGNNQLYGAAGADVMAGGAGNDTYYVDNVGDSVTEASGAGTDLVYSSIGYALGNNVESLILTGSANINGYGNSLANTLTGNSGNNFIDGGLGNDTLTGGGGQDTFAFDTALTGNVDTVADFGANETIRLDQSIFTAITTLGTLSAAAFFAGAAAHDSDDRVIFNSATGNLFYDSDGTGATAAVQFAHLNGAPSITNTSFNVVA